MGSSTAACSNVRNSPLKERGILSSVREHQQQLLTLTCELTLEMNLNLRAEGAAARSLRAMASLASCSFCCSSVNCAGMTI